MKLLLAMVLCWMPPAGRVAFAQSDAAAADRPVHAHTEIDRDVDGAAETSHRPHYSLADTRLEWPSGEQVWRVVSMRDYNTRVVLLGTLLLGLCSGTVGTFMLLRRRSLVGDVVGHASLPGIAIAFLVMEAIDPGSGKSFGGLLVGAAIAGVLGILCMLGISRYTRIKDDAALAIVLSVFFGAGIALFTIVQKIPTGSSAGLNHFIFGKAASMIADDVEMIAVGSLAVLLLVGLLFKELSLVCFDDEYAGVQGWPVVALDFALMGLVVGVSVIGLQSVGLLLIVAMLIIPAAAARFWTDDLRYMTLTSAAVGGLSAYLGVLVSAMFPRFAAGAVIVLVGSLLFLFSLLFGSRRGVVRRVLIHRRSVRRVGRHDLLRAIYELLEPSLTAADSVDVEILTDHGVTVERLKQKRSWSAVRLRRLLTAARRARLVQSSPDGQHRLTAKGAAAAQRAVRNHRLWEMYLISQADIAPSHVDRDADDIEHVLEPELIEELTQLVSEQSPQKTVPPSPHPIEQDVTAMST